MGDVVGDEAIEVPGNTARKGQRRDDGCRRIAGEFGDRDGNFNALRGALWPEGVCR